MSHCYWLAYDSQREKGVEPSAGNSSQTRRLWQHGGDISGKAKGMLWLTYRLLCIKAERVLNQSWPPWLLKLVLRQFEGIDDRSMTC